VNVRAADQLFAILDDDHAIPIETADWSNGLIITMSSGALIATGINRGPVRVKVDLRRAAPRKIDSSAWDDIVEASIYAPLGNLRVDQLEYAPADTGPDLPALSTAGPGHYRVRVHVRGRDTHADDVQDEPCEDYLIVAWPAPHAPSIIIRATDAAGYGLRLSGLDTTAARADQPPATLSPEQQAEARRQILLEQNLRNHEAAITEL
jgi:hypothetical protein